MDDRLILDMRRHEAVEAAAQAADAIIMDASDAQREELMLLTALLCKEFAEKLIFMVNLEAERKRIERELGKANVR